MTECRISWDSYKKNICDGFSHLQQREEFVDMTLAADGHLVKVHRNLLALASPYLREMLQSAPCQHPVVFLSNISHETLCYILEYIYTGEARVPLYKVNMFIEAAKGLCIQGLEDIIPPKNTPMPTRIDRENNLMLYPINRTSNLVKDPTPCKTNNMVLNQSFTNNNEANYHMDEVNDVVDESLTGNETVQEQNHTIEYETEIENVTKPINVDSKSKIDDNATLQLSQTNNNLKVLSKTNDENKLQSIKFDIKSCMTENNKSEMQNLVTDSKSKNPEISENVSAVNPLRIISVSVDDGLIIPEIRDNIMEMETVSSNIEIECQNIEHPATQSEEPASCYPQIIDVSSISVASVSETANFETGSNNDPNIKNPGIVQNLQGTSPLYVLSNRGLMQLILNRYIYCRHHTSHGGRKQRWRCIDYRRQGCKAFIDTDGEIIVERKFVHCHPFHDNKILQKGRKSEVFTSIEEVSKHMY